MGKLLPVSGTSSCPCVRSCSTESNSLILKATALSPQNWGSQKALRTQGCHLTEERGGHGHLSMARRENKSGEDAPQAERLKGAAGKGCYLYSKIDTNIPIQRTTFCTRLNAALGRDGEHLGEVNASRFLPTPRRSPCSKRGTPWPPFPLLLCAGTTRCQLSPIPCAGSSAKLPLSLTNSMHQAIRKLIQGEKTKKNKKKKEKKGMFACRWSIEKGSQGDSTSTSQHGMGGEHGKRLFLW